MHVSAKLSTQNFILFLLILRYFCSEVREVKWKGVEQKKIAETEIIFVLVALEGFSHLFDRWMSIETSL